MDLGLKKVSELEKIDVSPEEISKEYEDVAKKYNMKVEQVKKFFENRVFDTLIPRNVRLSEAPSYGEPISSYDPFSKGGRAYDKLVKEFLKKNEN